MGMGLDALAWQLLGSCLAIAWLLLGNCLAFASYPFRPASDRERLKTSLRSTSRCMRLL